MDDQPRLDLGMGLCMLLVAFVFHFDIDRAVIPKSQSTIYLQEKTDAKFML